MSQGQWCHQRVKTQHPVRSALEPPLCTGKTRCHACPSGPPEKCHTKNVVNKISCINCQNNKKSYFRIGETSQPVRERFKEHLSDARLRRLGGGLGKGILYNHTDIGVKEINSHFHIEMSRNRDAADNKVDESIKIRSYSPELNTHTQSWPIVQWRAPSAS